MKKEPQIYLTELFKLLKETFLHPSKHYIELGEDGYLWLWVGIGDTWHSIIFDEDYTDQTPDELVNEVVELLKPR